MFEDLGQSDMQEVLKVIGLYILGINLAGFLSMLIDKFRSRRNAWRIPEATLLLFAIAGGSIGSLIGMDVFHHKTQKPKFYIGIPIIIALQFLVIIYFIFFSPYSFRIM